MRRKTLTALTFLAVIITALYVCFANNNLNVMYSRDGLAMNTLIRISINSREGKGKVLDEAFELLVSLDKALSLYNPESEISQLNYMAGIQPVKVSRYVLATIQDAKKICELTDGIFNPMIGPVTKLWKINQDSGPEERLPDSKILDDALRLTDISNLEIEPEIQSVYLKRVGSMLDLSGIAKGYASQEIADFLRSNGVSSGLIDLGGNIFAVGKNKNGNDWNIGIRDPLEPRGVPAIVLKVSDTAVITSGNYERYKVIDGKKYSHFFDPKTGQPVSNDLLSVSVITKDGSMADALATAFMIAGYEKSLAILEKMNPNQRPGVIFIREGHRENEGSKEPEIFASKNVQSKIMRSKLAVKIF